MHRAWITLATALLGMVCVAGCQRRELGQATFDEANFTQVSDDFEHPDGGGAQTIHRYGCGSCHTIPGVRGANALVGPPLDHMASRSYIAGVMPNTRTNMLDWIQDPPKIDDKTAMPNLHVTRADAEAIADYLYTLY
jgi:cytochrome c